jgi:hypothetical protein
MNKDYRVRIGSKEVLEKQVLALLSSSDPEEVTRAKDYLGKQLAELRVRMGVLLKTDNVSFLLGAGASIAAGGVGLRRIPLQLERLLHNAATRDPDEPPPWLALFYLTVAALSGVELNPTERKRELDGDGEEDKTIGINVETFLSTLHLWREAIQQSPGGTGVVMSIGGSKPMQIEAMERLIKEMNVALASLLDLPIKGKEGALQDHRRLIKKVLTRPLNLRRANLFTLNYDTLIEQAADAEGAVLVDGFVGTLKRVFRPESYDLDFYFPAQTTEGRVHRFDRALHLYKLHGSLTWHRSTPEWGNPYGVHSSFFGQAQPEDDLLIYPSPLKYGQTLGLPYSELFRRFGIAIAQPQSVLITIGYGFGDEHINALIRQALAVPSFTLVVVDPHPTSDFVKQLADLEDERVWLVTGWKLGTMTGFVANALPDLRDEEITSRVVKTYTSLIPRQSESKKPDDSETNKEEQLAGAEQNDE